MSKIQARTKAQLNLYYEKLKEHFNGDELKTWEWFRTSHNMLGGIAPIDMIGRRFEKKVMKVIDNVINGQYL